MSSRSKIYDCILIALIAVLVFGNLGNGAQPARLFIMTLAPVMLVDAVRSPHTSLSYYRYECFFMLGWWLWALAFLYKTHDMTESCKHLIYLCIHILGFFEVIWSACRATDPQRSLQKGWLLLLAMTLPIAAYEFMNDVHFALSVQDTGANIKVGGISIERPFASVTFGNLNSYNTVLCWILPSLFMWNLFPKYKKDQLLGMALMLGTMLIIIANASRAAIMCLSVLLLVYVYCYYQMGRNRVLLISILTAVIGALVYFLIDIFILISERFSSQGFEDDGRSENIVQGVIAVWDSFGLGIGIGNYERVMNDVYRVIIPAPHNLFLEIFVCFGVFVFLGFLGIICRLYERSRKGDRINRYSFLFGVVAMLCAGIIDSTYVMKVPTWMFLASLHIYVDPRYSIKSSMV